MDASLLNYASAARGSESAVLTTKLYIPLTRTTLVSRLRLTKRLDEGQGRRLTLVCAPAGFGKTTLLGEWLAQSNKSVAWLSLDEGDNDPIRFLSHLIASLRTIQVGIGETTQALLYSPQGPPIKSILTLLLNEVVEVMPSLSLVLDDYHVIKTEAVHDALGFLLEHLPPQFHLILTSRSDPPLPLARLRARRELTELRSDELRFTPDETATFLRDVMGLSLAAEDVTALEARTEGWIAGLQLAALSMQGRSDLSGFITAFTGSHRYILDYLVEEVLRDQPENVQSFLLQTSVLERLSGPLCDAVTGQGGSGEMLERLEQANLFLIPLDDERRWYRYHHLFAEVLQNRLQQASPSSPIYRERGGAAELHHRASVWFESEGLLDDAVEHGLAARDMDYAGGLVERYAMPMIMQGEVLRVRAWLARFPGDVVLARPSLVLAHGWVLALTGHPEDADRLLDEAAAAFEMADVPRAVVAGLALLRSSSARFQGDLAAVPKLAQQALEVIPVTDRGSRAIALLDLGVAHESLGKIALSNQALVEAVALGESAGAPYVALAALGILATFRVKRGQLSEAVQACEQAVGIGARWGGRALPTVGIAQVILGELLCERGDLENASRVLRSGIEAIQRSNESTFLARGYVALARALQAQDDNLGAATVLEQGESWFVQTAIFGSYPLTLLAAARTHLALQQGDLARAAERATHLPLEDTLPEDPWHLTLIRLRLAESRQRLNGKLLGQVRQRLEQQLAVAEARGWLGDAIELCILLALVLERTGDPQGALKTLARALSLAEPEGYVRVFLDEGAPMAALLRQAVGHGVAAAYVAKLLVAFSPVEALANTPSASADLSSDFLPEPLNERELTILRLISAGLSDKEIAKELSLSFNTIKWYAQTIYRKLGVSKRAKAVARARLLGIL